MDKQQLFAWSIWIGVTVGVFSFAYCYTPIVQLNILFMAFISVPLFLSVGATRQLFPNYFCSAAAGVVWGLIYLFFINKMIAAGYTAPSALLVVVGVCTILCCALHMIVLGKTWFNTVPMIFGALAATFADGGQHPMAVFSILAAGLILALVISEGGSFIRKSAADKVDISN